MTQCPHCEESLGPPGTHHSCQVLNAMPPEDVKAAGTIAYGLRQPPAGWVWRTEANQSDSSLVKYSGHFLPAVGARVRVDMNKWGWGTVTGYFVEWSWMGVEVRIDKYPRWYVLQQKRHGEPLMQLGHFFGLDLGAVRPPTKDSHAAEPAPDPEVAPSEAEAAPASPSRPRAKRRR